MLTVFWDRFGLILLELSALNITSDTYESSLKTLNEKLRTQRPNKKKIILLHDNARPHTAKKIKKLISDLKWELLEHPPYSPDLSPSDYFLFSPLKNYLRGIRYPNSEELEFSIRNWFEKQSLDFFEKGIYKLPERWKSCISKEGDYFEKK